jgi:putative transposase
VGDGYDAMMLNGESGNGVRDPLTGESHGIAKRCIGVPGVARQNRIHVTGAIFHVVVRGCEDAALLAERQDCERFQLLVQHALVKCRARLCAYCWLPNAAHLVIKLSDVALESVMRQVCGPYSRYLHRQRGRDFRVYQSRYRARLIDPDLYLLPLLRYVHAMPVISGLCADPADYPWTSHRTYSGGAQIPWLAQAEVRAALHHRDRNIERAYRTLMSEPLQAWITEQFEHGSRADSRVAGGAGFADGIERKLAARRARVSFAQILAAVCHWQKVTPKEIFARSGPRRRVLVRSLVAWHVRACGAANLADLARWFGVRRWTLGSAIERHCLNNPDLFSVPLESILAQAPSPSDEVPSRDYGTDGGQG